MEGGKVGQEASVWGVKTPCITGGSKMAGRLEMEFHLTEPKTQVGERRGPDAPMRILVMADLSGRESRRILAPTEALAQRPIVTIDVDNLDDVLFRFAPRLRLPVGDPASGGFEVVFKALDDFHPDGLYQRVELFNALRQLRGRLLDPATFSEAAAELRQAAIATAPEATRREEVAEKPITAADENDSATLERLLGRPPADTPRPRPSSQPIDVNKLIHGVVAPYIVPEADPFVPLYVEAVDSAIAEQMRALLHHPAFQGLEATWRSVATLVTGVETGEELQLFLLDVTKEELAADLAAVGGDLAASALYRRLLEEGVQTPGGEPWSLLVGDYTFGTSTTDISLLAALGAVASHAGGPFLAAADPALVGCASLAESPDPAGWSPLDDAAAQRWRRLRESAVARWIGLALPRLLLRLPYGRRSDPVDGFPFEEMAGDDHAAYLWGNPAFGCARLIADAFQESGWSMEPGDRLDLEDLPAHTFDDDGERRLKPCAEVCLGERAADALLARGIMPLMSYRNRNAVRLARFQSLADPPAPLAGPWG